MLIIPNQNVVNSESFGQFINKVKEEFIDPELKKRNTSLFSSALIEILDNNSSNIYLDDDFEIMIEFKEKKSNPNDTGKKISLDIKDIKDIGWKSKKISKRNATILVVRFNSSWWLLKTNFKERKDLDEKFQVRRTFKVRGGGYLPLKMRRQEKGEFMQQWQNGLKKELPAMWSRYITTTQRYRGVMVYDGNYFDLFIKAQEFYILGDFYPSIVMCRIAAEQALVNILINKGSVFEIYKKEGKSGAGGKPMSKGIYALVKSCRNKNLFKKLLINKTAEKKLTDIADLANELVHPKNDLAEMDKYKKAAVKCMDNLNYVIKTHLNFVKDTKTVSDYKFSRVVTRLK
ncbi:MAG: hypothetical protein WC545_00480 [Patescibacteria group bacterium]|jgi:hypothetical protein